MNSNSRLGLIATLVFAALLYRQVPVAAQQDADLVITGGTIATMDPGRPLAEALAVKQGRIVAVGDREGVLRRLGSRTRHIELKNEFVMPGFIEGHGHLLSLGESRMMLDLTNAQSWQSIVELVERAAQEVPDGRWIVGRGWHQGKWNKPVDETSQAAEYPHHEDLSRRTRKHPVLLTHASGHMVIANARAMELAGIDATTPAIPGGEILRDSKGQPTGVFRENAAGPIRRAYERSLAMRTADESASDQLRALRLAVDECLRLGVTSFQDAGVSLAEADFLRRLAEAGELRIRLWLMLNDRNEVLARALPKYRCVGLGDNFLTIRAIKRMSDGALGTHGAWLLEPFDDLPASTGHNVTSIESLQETAKLALQHDFQLCVHAIGDRANRETLDLFERTAPDIRTRRWRIEHAQHLHTDDISRFGKLGVLASMQGVHCTSDAPFVVSRLGLYRARTGAYAWRSLLDHGATIVNGTDTPVESVDPLACFRASVTRQLADGSTFFPEQKMTRQEALRSYTRDAAYGAFEESLKGTLEVGKLGDLVVVSRNLLTCPDADLDKAKILITIVNGTIAFDGR